MRPHDTPLETTTASAHARPTIRPLTQHECIALIARNHVGRLAFSFRDRVEIQPLHYVYESGWIYGRTSEGAKLTTLAHNQWIAFEVDEVRGIFDWASVVVHGSFHRVDPDALLHDVVIESHAITLLRRIIRETFTPEDPVPSRTVTFRISIGETTGRTAIPG